ncbi:MAG: decarboxylase, partial [Clostridiales bacterium]|nr:decarboxylase [Clostridiales bacterium]
MSEYLLDRLTEYVSSDAYPLHMPGHKRQISHFEHPFSIDITEIEGFDNLHHPEGILLQAQERAARLYGADATYYLVNGSTCGILAAVSASVRRGGRILMARNSHKAAYHAAFLNGLHVTWLYPEADSKRGICGSIH